MANEKSLVALRKTFLDLCLSMEEINKNATRDRKCDFPIMSQKELDELLKSETSNSNKKKLLLTQIGNLRINSFAEYYEQVYRAQSRNELDKAVKLMGIYAETIAIPFVSTVKESKLTKRLKEWLSAKKIVDHLELIKEWRTGYESWFKRNENAQSHAGEKNLKEEFDQLKISFFKLYTYSFSVDNYPPLRNRRTDHE